ncbi:MAG TPA: hypothetical protein PK992_15250, partial [Planctomycetaceae bacterium]|nr:hypothetical protein [Planctomycetaceae bacterium]
SIDHNKCTTGNDLRLGSQTEKHELSHLYEAKIKNMGNAGRSGGEYYRSLPLVCTIRGQENLELGFHECNG